MDKMGNLLESLNGSLQITEESVNIKTGVDTYHIIQRTKRRNGRRNPKDLSEDDETN